jgi:hypothetical protein
MKVIRELQFAGVFVFDEASANQLRRPITETKNKVQLLFGVVLCMARHW